MPDVIVVFGSSTDIGRRLVKRLKVVNLTVRTISRSSDADLVADLESGEGVAAAMASASTVVSCAHARFTQQILRSRPPGAQLVLTGSAWRYSQVPNHSAQEVRDGEKAFVASGVDGVMLHPAMIYGGSQENNIRRLIRVLKRLPLIPVPGGGRHTVQPIYVEDVAECLFSAVTRQWIGPNVLPIGGDPIIWRDMVEMTGEAIGLRRRVVSIPLRPAIVAAAALNLIGVQKIDANVFRRFGESASISTVEIVERLKVHPRHFCDGIRIAVEEWGDTGVI